MKIDNTQRLFIHTLLHWLDSISENTILVNRSGVARNRDIEFIKEQLHKVLILNEYDRIDRELLNSLRETYLDSIST
jgi:hypothetical protein